MSKPSVRNSGLAGGGTQKRGAARKGKAKANSRNMTGAPLLEIRQLRKNFGGVQAIDGVNFEIYQNEIVGVIGPNGSGKTTTFNVVTGLVPASSGSIVWNGGKELVGEKPWSIFELGIARTFQNIRLCLGMSILENVMTGLYSKSRTTWAEVLLATSRVGRLDALTRARAMEAIRFVSAALAESPDRLVAELSYADRRRVEIARAIVSEPKLLLLDEPTAGMNSGETDELAEDVLKVNASGVSVILVEHKMKFVSDLADRVIVLSFGRKITEGTFEEIRSDAAVIEAYLGRSKAA